MDSLHVSSPLDLRKIITGMPKANVPSSGKELKQFKEELLSKTVRFCDKCGYKYTADDVEIIRMDAHSVAFGVKCRQCDSTHVVVAQVGPSAFKVDKAEMLLDLDPKQLPQYFERGPITYTDVIRVVKRLRNVHVGASIIVDVAKSSQRN